LPLSIFENYHGRVSQAVSGVQEDQILAGILVIRNTVDAGSRIWIAGNGGSAATASHFATDLSRCTTSNGALIKAISLCDNAGLITAIGNDFGFDFVFSRQLSNAAVPGDLLVVLTASGNSRNLLVAMDWAKSHDVKVLALTGFSGGKVKDLADISIHVPTEIGDYGVAEDAHSILCHFLSSQFRINS